MVVKEDGSKWACTSCLKGHRVSGCNHTDRELHLVPKKGRPVTQCQHCRQERKKRSAHVSCDCAATDKPHHTKEKCIHLREAEERAKVTGFLEDGGQHEKDGMTLYAVAEEQGCCCHHGGKCTCALLLSRKDSSDDGGLPHGKPAVPKPRLDTTKSDGSITIFSNGHHKPVHRKNHAAHECGMPYKLPMPRSKTEHDVSYAARRSVDSLSLNPKIDFSQYNTQALLRRPGLDTPGKMAADLFSNADGLTSDKFNMVDFSDIDQPGANQSTDLFPPLDPLSGLLESPAFDDWPAVSSADGMMPNNNPFGVWTTNADTTGLAQPALTVASSGTQSEIDEVPSLDDIYTHGMPAIQEMSFDLSNPVLGNSPQTNRRSLPPGFFGNIDFTNVVSDEWQAQLDPPATNMFNDKPANAPFAFNDPWQTADRRIPTSYAASPGRPMARSLGPASAPGTDLMRQLFPDMDVDSNYQTQSQGQGTTNVGGEVPYITQAWTDGSMSIPMDPFGTPLPMGSFDGGNFDEQTWPQ